MNSRISVLVTPRDGVHYQDLLYRDIIASGVEVHYDVGPTRSQTLNVLLAPLRLVWWRAKGCRIVHLHWVFHFALPWARHDLRAQRLMRWWFGVYLKVSALVGLRLVWTAHDLLPHDPVFDDDAKVRDLLISRARLIIALSAATADQLRALGAHDVVVIPLGAYADPYPQTMTRERARASFGVVDDALVVGLVGRLDRYKGADLLLSAVAALGPDSRTEVIVAGACAEDYRRELEVLAQGLGSRAHTHFDWIDDADLVRYFQAADVAVFPFREITNSASVMLALSLGRPTLIADLPTLADIPTDVVMRYEPRDDESVEPLVVALQRLEELSSRDRERLSEAAMEFASHNDWASIATRTIEAYRRALS